MEPSPSRPTLRRAGQVVGGKYELDHVLGRGAMGEVWAAHHRTLDDYVALKLLKGGSWGYGTEELSIAAARFRFEAQVAARLSHKTRHIVRVTDHGEEDGLAYLVMELLAGQTLESWLKHHGCMALEDVPRVVTQLARALEEAHAEGVVHRDLKPGNIFLTLDEEGGLLVKVLDFGIARATPASRKLPSYTTAPGVLFGTPGYMSPEQVGLPPVIDHHCDLWALATVAYELLTGKLPVPGAHPGQLVVNLRLRRLVPIRERMPAIPLSVDAFFQMAFAQRLEDRFANASELAIAFERAAVSPSAPVAGSTGSGGTVRMRTLQMGARPPVSLKRRRPRRVYGLPLLMLAAPLGLVVLTFASRSPSTGLPVSLPEIVGPGERKGEAPLQPPAIAAPTWDDPTEGDVSRGSSGTDRRSGSGGSDPHAAPTVAPSSSPGAAAVRPNCKPPFKVDADGKKRWIRECL